jgi:leader peptidase (prepilin peptidase)/N-methyltransferase
MQCGAQLRWFNLIPILSWILQRGRCSVCHSHVSLQYPLVEISTGILFLLSWFTLGLQPELLILLIQVAVLVLIFVYDLRHKIIPDAFSYVFAGVSLIGIVYTLWLTNSFSEILLSLIAGPVLASPFVLLVMVSRGRWMGMGDAKLALGIGWMLGLLAGYFAIAIGFWLGAIIGLVGIGLGRISNLSGRIPRVTMTSEVPFGPFLVTGTVMMAFWGNAVLHFFGFIF